MKKRTIIWIQEYQPEFDFEEAEHVQPYTLPEYQSRLIGPRIAAGLTDFGIVGAGLLVLVHLALIGYLVQLGRGEGLSRVKRRPAQDSPARNRLPAAGNLAGQSWSRTRPHLLHFHLRFGRSLGRRHLP